MVFEGEFKKKKKWKKGKKHDGILAAVFLVPAYQSQTLSVKDSTGVMFYYSYYAYSLWCFSAFTVESLGESAEDHFHFEAAGCMF